MAFIPAVDTARVAMHFRQDGQQVENVFYVQDPTGWDATSLTALGALVKGWWITNMQPQLAATLSLVEIVCKDMTTSLGTEVVYTSGLPVFGGSSNVPMPNNVTVAIKLITALGGRSFRGRQYILGMVDGQIDASHNQLTTGAAAFYTTNYNNLISVIDAVHTPGLVIASFHAGGAPRVTALLTPVTTAAFADITLDSQRRRLPGRGR